MTPPVQPGDALRLTARALADQTWRFDPPLSPVGMGILLWLRDEATLVQEILDSFDDPAQHILDTARLLIERGLVEVAVDEPEQCDLAAGVHTMPHRGCILR